MGNPYEDVIDEQDAPQAAAPTAQAPPNPYLDLMNEESGLEETRLRGAFQQSTLKPDEAAEASTIAIRLGVPQQIVERNLPDYKKRYAIEGIPYQQIEQQSPKLAAALKAKPEIAAVVKDDLENLGAWEWLTTAPQRAMARGINQVRYAQLRHQSIFRELTREEKDQLFVYKQAMHEGGELGTAGNWFKGAITGAFEQLPNTFGASLMAGKRAIQAGGTAAGVGMLTGPIMGVAVPAMVTGAATAGARVGAGEFSFQMESALALDEFMETPDEFGRHMDPKVAKVAAIAVGTVNAGLEVVGLELLARTVPGLKNFSGAAVRGAVKQALRVPTIRAALANVAKDYGEALGGNVVEEVAQRAITILGGEVIKYLGTTQLAEGQTEPGNIDLYKQPTVPNADGSVSTVHSFSIEEDGREVLLPTVTAKGEHLEEDAAIAEYRRTGKHLGKFTTPAAATTFATKLHDEYEQGLYQQTAGYHRTAWETLGDLWRETTGSFQGLALMPLPGAVMTVAQDVRRANQAADNVAYFKALAQGAKDSKTIQRMPQVAQDLIAEATKGGPLEHLYAPTGTFSEYWQSKNVDPEEMAAELTGDSEAWQTAVRTGEDLRIPTARYATKIAGTEHHAYFAEELRVDPDGMNQREAKAFAEQQKATRSEPKAPSASELEREQVRTQTEERLTAAAVPSAVAGQYANLVEAFAGTIGESEGVRPTDVIGPNLRIARPDVDVLRPAGGQATAAAAQSLGTEATPTSDVAEAAAPSQEAPAAAQAAAAAGPSASASFLAFGPGGPLYNVVGGPADRSTVGPERLTELGIAVPSTPEDTGERLTGEQVRDRMAAAAGPRAEAAIARAVDAQPTPTAEAVARRPQFDPDERIDLTDMVAAAKRMRAEDPLIDAKAKALAERSRSSRTPAPPRVRASGSDILVESDADQPATREDVSDRAREQRQADQSRLDEGAREGRGAEPRRLQTPGIPELDEVFERQPADANARRLTPEVRRELERIFEELGTFQFTPHTIVELGPTEKKTGNYGGGNANIIPGSGGASVYHDVLGFSPVNLFRGKPAKLARGDRGDVARAVGLVLSTNDIPNNLAEGAVRVAEHRNAGIWTDLSFDITTLPPHWGTEISAGFDNALDEAIDLATAPEADLLADSTAVDQEPGEDVGTTSFDVSEFDQPTPTPAPASGMVRLYHGGALAAERTTGSVWFSSDLAYAQGYADKAGGTVSYVDVPADDPLIAPDYPEQSITAGFHQNVNVPADLARQRQPFVETGRASEFDQGLFDLMEEPPPEPEKPARKSRTIEEMRAEMQARRDAVAAEFATIPEDARAVTLTDPQGSVLSITRSTSKPGVWQLTRFLEDGTPAGHDEYPSRQQAYESARGIYGTKTYGPSYGSDRYRLTEVHTAAGEVVDAATLAQPTADVLDTGELQGRLPGQTGAVRETEIATPEMDAPFSLTSETQQRKPRQDTFFQSAYHGSPHIFDRFSLHAMGTGEGAQAYGWGLYFAGKREVADWYREKLTERGLDTTQQQALSAIKKHGSREAAIVATTAQVEAMKRAISLQQQIGPLVDAEPFDRAAMDRVATERDAAFEAAGVTSWRSIDQLTAQQHVLEGVLEVLPTAAEKAGRTYTVEIPEDEDFLDYNKPLSEQSAKVKAALEKLGVEIVDIKYPDWQEAERRLTAILDRGVAAADYNTVKEGQAYVRLKDTDAFRAWWAEHAGKLVGWGDADRTQTGETLYRDLQVQAQRVMPHLDTKEAARFASEQLRSVGLAGMRYLDGSSRRAGEGSYNYVVVDDRLVEITEFDQPLQPEEGPSELTAQDVEQWAAGLKEQIPELSELDVRLTSEGDLHLDTIATRRGTAGAGTRAMEAVIRFADLHGKLMTLSLADKGYSPTAGGKITSSRARLQKFYRAFGFRDNTGRAKNFRLPMSTSMYREPTLSGKGLELKAPPVPRSDAGLIIQHNVTAANLLHAQKMGGFPVPSFAINKAADSLVNFGEITLLGPKEMADPKGYAKTRVFAADVYSPRYPTIHYKLSAASERKLSAIVKEHGAQIGRTYFDLDTLQQEGAKALEDEPAVMVAFLKEQGLEVPKPEKYPGEERIDSSRTRNAIRDVIDETDERRQAFRDYAVEVFRSLDPTEHIYRGFTNMGNKRYQAHTLDNVVAILKRDIQGGESESNIYGVGQLRARFTERFRSVKAIQKAAGRIVTNEQFEAVKKEVERELFAITDAVKPYYAHDSQRFGFVDTVLAVMEETPKRGLVAALKHYDFNEVPAETRATIHAYLAKLRTLPTEYFEAKILREVGLPEFAAAVVPSDTNPEVLQALTRAGLTVETYERRNDAERKRVVADLSEKMADRLLFQGEGEGTAGPTGRPDRRGSIRFGPSREITISLFEKADPSTLIHEFGHLFLRTMEDLEARPEASERLKGMMGTLRQWYADNGIAEDDEVGRQELFARGFEQYSLEGKAPSLALRDVFHSFRAWMLGVYRSIRGLKVNLTPEVRDVFDRMLATDQAIAEAKASGKVAPMFLTAAAAGMSEREFALYSSTIQDANRTETERLERKVLGEVRREQEADWKRQRDDIKLQVQVELGDSPTYRALSAMRTGTNPDGSPMFEGMDPEPLKLSRQILLNTYGAEKLRTLPAGIYSKEGGLHPDLVAERVGFTSGDEMLNAIAGARPYAEAVETETTSRMLERHGSMLLDGSLPEQAQAAVANEDRESVLRAELRALAKLRAVASPFRQFGEAQLRDERRERAYERRWFEAETQLRIAIAEGHKQVEIDELAAELRNMRQKARGGAATIAAAVPPAGEIREMATTRIAGMRIRDIAPQRFWSAAMRAGQQATALAARQDFDAAIVAKQQQLLSLALYREAMRVRDDVQARYKAALKLDSKASRQAVGVAGASYQEQIDGLLDRFELAQVSRKALDKRADLRKWVAAMEGDGQPVDIPEDVLNEARRVNWQEVTVEEFVGVTDALQHIAHLARFKNRLLKAKAARELGALASSLATSIRDKFRGTPPQHDLDRRPSGERSRMIGDFFASHRKLASILRVMDGLEDGGPMTSAIMFTLNEAGDREAVMTADATQRLNALVETAFPGRAKAQLYELQEVKAIGRSLSKMSRLMVAMNWGNEGNRQRIRDGNKWNDGQVQAILDTLSASDLTFVQGVFDLFESYRPEIGAKAKRITGIEPSWVEAVPITTAAGTFRGGYFPLKYDDRQSASAIRMLDLEAANMAQHAAYTQATTKRGHEKERLATVRVPVRLDFGPIFEHLGQVIHDLSHHEALLDVGRILGHRDVQAAILETYGDLTYKQMRNAIRDVAFGTVPARGGFEQVINHIRQGSTVVGLGWNLTTTLMQPLGLTNSINRIGAKWVARGIGRFLRGPETMQRTVAWISEVSPFMRMRGQTQQREISEIRQAIGIASSGGLVGWVDDIVGTVTNDTVTRHGIADSYFYFIQQAQRIADVPTWLGQYEKSMEAGETEERAVAMADQAVLDSQGGGQVKDLAGVQRGGPMMKLWTNFYSFFNVVHQQHVEAHARYRLTEDKTAAVGRLASDYLMLYIVPASLGLLIRQGLKGGGGGKDDDSAWLQFLAENASYLAGTMLGTREVAGALQGSFGYEGPAGARAFASLARLGVQVRQVAEKGDKAIDWPLFKSVIEVGGVLFHFPAGQVNRTIAGVKAIAEGKTSNPLAVLVGPPLKKAR